MQISTEHPFQNESMQILLPYLWQQQFGIFARDRMGNVRLETAGLYTHAEIVHPALARDYGQWGYLSPNCANLGRLLIMNLSGDHPEITTLESRAETIKLLAAILSPHLTVVDQGFDQRYRTPSAFPPFAL